MILQSTKKLQTYLGISGIALPSFAEPCACWHGNLLQVGRRKALLLTHNESYYSLVIQGITKKELPSLEKRIYERLKQQLLQDDFTPKEIEAVLYFSQTFSYFKSSHKRVLGVMNDMANTIAYARHHEESDDMTISSRINNTPYKAGDYFYPKKAFKVMARQWSNQ